MIIINFKNYKVGESALRLAKHIEKYLPKSLVAVSAVDIGYMTYHTKLKVLAQHIDCVEGNRGTGYLSLEAVKSHDGKGSLLNHSEHPVSLQHIKTILTRAQKLGLKMIVCAAHLIEVKEIMKLHPYAIALEDPDLIGTGRSITKHQSQDVGAFANILSKTNIIPICGAGISNAEDVKAAYQLGCKGVLISSAIANSKNPISLLKELKKI